MLIRIDPRSDRPIYLQIASAIESQIEGGGLSTGDRLPPARSLSASLGGSMHTVHKAYSHLQEESLVEMRRGRGGVVVGKLPDLDRLAERLVSVAERSGMTRDELDMLIEAKWR